MLHFLPALSIVSLTCISYASGHAKFTFPQPREPGTLFTKYCGQKAADSLKQVQGVRKFLLPLTEPISGELLVAYGSENPQQMFDCLMHLPKTGPIEDFGTAFPDPQMCVPTICHGFLFEDQPPTQVQVVTPGQKLDLKMLIAAKHAGSATVQIVDTKKGGSPVGPPLVTFADFASTEDLQKTHASFSVTIPKSSAFPTGACTTAGDCAVQFVWKVANTGPGFQTYESCIDIKVNIGGKSSADHEGKNTPPSGPPVDNSQGTTNTGTGTSSRGKKDSCGRRRGSRR